MKIHQKLQSLLIESVYFLTWIECMGRVENRVNALVREVDLPRNIDFEVITKAFLTGNGTYTQKHNLFYILVAY